MVLAIVSPVLNDWESFRILLGHLDKQAEAGADRIKVYAVDDGSTSLPFSYESLTEGLTNLQGLEIVQLALNMGHQRAIAIGICVALTTEADQILVMDSDGEDVPEQIPTLLSKARDQPNAIVVAKRGRRQEGMIFRLSYIAYRLIFRLFVGKPIRFGNFSLLSRMCAERIVLMPELWGNLAAALLRSRLPMIQVSLDRGKRYAGKSQMNLTSLIIHAFSAIGAYAEVILVRLLLTSLALFLLTILSVATTVGLRLFAPAFATPGWATTVSFGMVILLTQVVFVTLTSILMLFNNRVQKQVIPVKEYEIFIARRLSFAIRRV